MTAAPPPLRVLLSGGGSGGHVFPAFAVANVLRDICGQQERSLHFRFAGTRDGVEARLADEAGYRYARIAARPMRGRNPLRQTLAAAANALGVINALVLIARFRPHVVFLTGGYVGAPVGLAAWLSRRPIVLFQPDIEPGWTHRALAPLASIICVTHESAAEAHGSKSRRDRFAATGYPLRPGFANLDQQTARRHFQLDDGPALLVTGAVRGAQRINNCIADRLREWLERAQLIHISGPDDHERLSALRDALPDHLRPRYHLHPYLSDEMPLAMAACDLAISRAGASTMGEYPAAALPAVLVPLPEAGGHQRRNAQILAEQGAAILLDDDKISADLFDCATAVLADRGRLSAMRDAMLSLRRSDAAERIAQLVITVAK